MLYGENSAFGTEGLEELEEGRPKSSSIKAAKEFLHRKEDDKKADDKKADDRREDDRKVDLDLDWVGCRRNHREVLIFRAVVMAAFLSTVADLSDVIGTEVGKRVVQFV